MNRRLIIAGAATVAGVFAMPAVAQEESARSLPERFAATLSSHDIAAFAALFAEDYINHQMSAASPAPPRSDSALQRQGGSELRLHRHAWRNLLRDCPNPSTPPLHLL